jgi:serine/threonine-protein kinase
VLLWWTSQKTADHNPSPNAAALAAKPNVAPPAASLAPSAAVPEPRAAQTPVSNTATAGPPASASTTAAGPASEAAPAGDSATAAAGKGTLRLLVSPWAEVEVDGKSQGVSPPLTRLRLPAGEHTVVLRNSGFAPKRLKIQVTANGVAQVQHRFE